jgi:uncharacterized membrane protein YjfL (UPF0719 family)
MNFSVILLNTIYSIIGGVLTIIFMKFSYKMLDKITPFDTSEELKKGNRAVGSAVMGIFIGVGVAMGLVIGMALN